jgi:Flp pilus assembly protein TadG
MPNQTLFDRLRDRALRFRSAKGGNVVMTFALATVPIMGFVGSAVDYSRANSAKAAMQMAIDATGLMLSKEVTKPGFDLNKKATDYFKSLFNRPEVTNIMVTPVYTTEGGSQVVVTATGVVPTTFMKVVGFQQLNIEASTTVKWGNTRLRVALVLDVTGSMSSAGKIGALKTATTNLLAQLKAAGTKPEDVYVSIVPFSKDVNLKLDTNTYTQTWIRWDDNTDASWDGANGTCSKSGNSPRSVCKSKGDCSNSSYTSQSSCTSHGTCSNSSYTSQSNCTSHGTCSKSQYTTQSTCTSNSGTWTAHTWTAYNWTPATWTPSNHNTWNGCVTDRDQDYDTKNTAPTPVTPATLVPAEQYSSCPTATIGLSNDWTKLNAKVGDLSPNGNTNQGIGLQWGWQTLTSSPFTIPAKEANYTYKEVIILMTDGLNTENRYSTVQADIDAREQITCNNVNAAGITLYTVQVNTGGDPTSTLLKKCAGSPGKYPDADKFFLLTSASALITTFQQIGTELSNLRVAK